MTDDNERDEAERRVRNKREALKATIEAVQKKIGGDAGRLESAVNTAKDAVDRSTEVMQRYAWVFVAGAFTAGMVLGTRNKRRSRAPLALPSGLEDRVVYVMDPDQGRRSSIWWGIAGLAGKLLLRGLVSAITAGAVAEEMVDRQRPQRFGPNRGNGSNGLS